MRGGSAFALQQVGFRCRLRGLGFMASGIEAGSPMLRGGIQYAWQLKSPHQVEKIMQTL